MSRKPCKIEACPSKSANGGMCWRHYNIDYKNRYSVSRKRKYKRSEKGKLHQKIYHDKARLEALLHYSQNELKFNCCGETTYEFLTLEHIFNNGAQHRREINNRNLYIWCRKNQFPVGFQVLCMNCNFAKEKYRGCPHMKSKNVLRKAGI